MGWATKKYEERKEEFKEVLLLAMDKWNEKKVSRFTMGRSILNTPILTIETPSGKMVHVHYDSLDKAKEELNSLEEGPTTFTINNIDDYHNIPNGTTVKLSNGSEVRIDDKDIRMDSMFIFFDKGRYKLF